MRNYFSCIFASGYPIKNVQIWNWNNFGTSGMFVDCPRSLQNPHVSHSLGYANMGLENLSYLQMIFVLTPSCLVDFPASHVWFPDQSAPKKLNRTRPASLNFRAHNGRNHSPGTAWPVLYSAAGRRLRGAAGHAGRATTGMPIASLRHRKWPIEIVVYQTSRWWFSSSQTVSLPEG